MEKVGILSMQRIINYGSFLQAYGLKRIISSINPNLDVIFIDYRAGKPLVESKEESGNKVVRIIAKGKKYLGQNDVNMIDKIKFVKFKYNYQKKYLSEIGVKSTKNYKTSDLDLLVIGSDEVFNCVQSNSRVGFTRTLFGYNSDAKCLISYAASFGNTNLGKIEHFNLGEVLTHDLKNFDSLSVRDLNSQKVIESLTGNSVKLNIDPVLAYDFFDQCTLIPKKRIHNEKYIVVYGYSGRFSQRENKDIQKYARKVGCRILAFGGLQGCEDEFIDCSPFELLAYFRDAEFVITDTFHGSIFSMISHTPFITVVRKSEDGGYGNEEKLTSLLSLFHLKTRITYSLNKDSIKKISSNEIEFNTFDEILKTEREKTINYIKKYV